MADATFAAVDAEFDFGAHRDKAEEKYREVRGTYEDLASTVRAIVLQATEDRAIPVHSIEYRAKALSSFGDKASRENATTGEPKYPDPLNDISDLAGCRVITFFLDDVARVQEGIESEFDVLERADRSSRLRGGGQPGYESYHYLVRLRESRLELPEYRRFRGLRAEIQVRTILQHAWAEIEHDIQYKSVDVLPTSIGRRFVSLSGLIEIADREFQAIADEHELVRQNDRQLIETDRLEQVEVTADSVRDYLNRHFGPDLRIRDWGYDWFTRLLKGYGFSNLRQLDDAVVRYGDGDALSRAVHGSRRGQLTRAELAVFAALGPDRTASRHPWNEGPEMPEWFQPWVDNIFDRLDAAGIEVDVV